MRLHRFLTCSCAVAFLASCGSGSVTQGNAVLPPVSTTNPQNVGKLQFAVGTAKLADGTLGLNVVSTFRQSNGLSATLVNTPSITGPTGFTVPNTGPLAGGGKGGSGTDAGTASITSIGQAASVATPAPAADTFGSITGVFASGLSPFNTTQSGNAFYPGNANGGINPSFGEPFFANTYDGSNPTQPFLLGPPSVPYFNDGTYPNGFAGYQTGFTAFEMAPVTGTYTMSVIVAASNAASATFTQTATLNGLTPLPALPAPTFTEDAAGGGTASVTVPAGSAISETIIYVVDTKSGTYYSSGALTGSGALTFTLPDMLGKCVTVAPNCENSTSQQAPSIASGDTYLVYAASFDYPQFEAEPPSNKSQTPTIAGSNGQADVTLSPALSATY